MMDDEDTSSESEEILTLKAFFDEHTMSVHLIESNPPRAKRGTPGNWELVELSNRILTYDELDILAEAIMETAEHDKDSFIEIEEEGAAVVQLRNMRLAIAGRPFADKMEISAIRPM